MAKLGPILVRLGFILVFVYVWYVITSAPSEEPSVLLNDENSDLQMQAILSKLEDDQLGPDPSDRQTVYPSVPDQAATDLSSEAEQAEAPVQRVDQSDTKRKDEHDSAETTLWNKINKEHKMSHTDSGEVTEFPIRPPQFDNRPLLKHAQHKGDFPGNTTDTLSESVEKSSPGLREDVPDNVTTEVNQEGSEPQATDNNKGDFPGNTTDTLSESVEKSSPGLRKDVPDNVTTEVNQEGREPQATDNNEGGANILKNIWKKIVEPPGDLDTKYETGKGSCPPGDVLTIVGGGRLANCIWEYATVHSLSRFLPGHRTPYVQKFIIDSLSNIFDSLTLPVVEDIPKDCKCCESINWYEPNIHIYSFIPMQNSLKKFKGVHGSLILPKYSLLIEPVLADRNNVMQEMKFKKEIHEAAVDTIRRAAEEFHQKNNVGEARVTFVGVHIRRTDYLRYLSEHYKMTEATPEYFATAMDYFRHQRPDLGVPVFLVVSDDVAWVETNLLGKSDVFSVSVGGIESPGHDLAVLCYCNHSIIDYGTFGLWAALQAGGETVSIKTSNQVYQVLGKQKNWHFVSFDGNKHSDIW